MFWSVADPAWGLCVGEDEKLQVKGINQEKKEKKKKKKSIIKRYFLVVVYNKL